MFKFSNMWLNLVKGIFGDPYIFFLWRQVDKLDILKEGNLKLRSRSQNTAASCVAIAVPEMPSLRRLLQCGTAVKLN